MHLIISANSTMNVYFLIENVIMIEDNDLHMWMHDSKVVDLSDIDASDVIVGLFTSIK